MARFLAFLLAALLLVGGLSAACSSGGEDAASERTLVLERRQGGSVRLRVEVAATPEERQRGLSNRPSLAENAGMLFIIEQRGPGFWMKDTLIPLSVAFIAACGEIVHIAHMEPLSLQIHSTERDYSFGLEVNQGWFERNRIGVGDRVLIPEAYRRPGCS
jgi:uncharacterized membrane protein (UPF0127 family)